MEESWRRKWKVVRKWNVIVWKGILFLFSVSWHHSTLLQTHWASVSLKSCPVWFVFVYVLTACVFVTQLETQYVIRDALYSENLFVNRIVRDPRRSWTEVWLYLLGTCCPCGVSTNSCFIIPSYVTFNVQFIYVNQQEKEMELYPSYTNMYLTCQYCTHSFYSPCFAWIPPTQMWNDLKNENRQNIYGPQNVKSHWS